MQVLLAASVLPRFTSARLRARIAGLVGALALSACSAVGGGDIDVSGDADAAAISQTERVAALETEVAQLKARNSELEKEVAALHEAAESRAQAAAIIPTQGPAVRPETVVAAADVGQALANAPAKPVQLAPRLVQPTFASGQETSFENEAEGAAIKMSSVLYGVHLASYRSIGPAKSGWRKLQRENPDELGLLEPRIERVTIEGRGDFIRLIGGGFSTEDKAGALCATLQAKGVYCAVTGFGGERLSLADSGGD